MSQIRPVAGSPPVGRPIIPPNADIWVLAGQSNMAGSGFGEDYETPDGNVWLFTLRDEWEVAREPFVADRYDAIDEAFAIMRGEREKHLADSEYRRNRSSAYFAELLATRSGGGLGLPFGKAISSFTRRPTGLVFCAKGDTRMAEWDPDYMGPPFMALYRATIRRLRAVGRQVTGILWFQGESDTFGGQGNRYFDNMKRLVAAFRRDLAQPDLPFFYVQISSTDQQTEEELPEWNLVQESQRRLESLLTPGGMVSSIDLPRWDGIHLSTSALGRLGRRLATVARRSLYGDRGVEIGPRLSFIEREPNHPARLRVRFSSVNRRLSPAEGVEGFSIYFPNETQNRVRKTFIEQMDATAVVMQTDEPIPTGSTLWYGKGLNPSCNLVDAADLAAPVFGPCEILPESGFAVGK